MATVVFQDKDPRVVHFPEVLTLRIRESMWDSLVTWRRMKSLLIEVNISEIQTGFNVRQTYIILWTVLLHYFVTLYCTMMRYNRSYPYIVLHSII